MAKQNVRIFLLTSAGLTIFFLMLIMSPPAAEAFCCWGGVNNFADFSSRCADGQISNTLCCGRGACNIFCCNCAGDGCLGDPLRRRRQLNGPKLPSSPYYSSSSSLSVPRQHIMDYDADGYLALEEVKQFWTRGNVSYYPPEIIHQHFASHDRNYDGRISYDELE